MIDLPDEVAGVGNPPVRYQSNSVKIPDVFAVIDEYCLTYYEGHALKYLVRLGQKGSDESNLGKCRHFLKESELRAPVRVNWVETLHTHITIEDVNKAFGIRFELQGVVSHLLSSKLAIEPRYWLRLAGEQLDSYLNGTYEE